MKQNIACVCSPRSSVKVLANIYPLDKCMLEVNYCGIEQSESSIQANVDFCISLVWSLPYISAPFQLGWSTPEAISF